MSIYIEINDEKEFNFFITHSKICVAYFHASYCGPCKELSPKLEDKMKDDKYTEHVFVPLKDEISKSDITDKIVFIKINAMTQSKLVSTYAISALPTLLFFESGKKKLVIEGANFKKIINTIDVMIE
jgi:thiol-disulfide isomerase/thioredoxin